MFLLVSARFLPASPRPWPTRIPRILRPELRLAPKATPPASPASAAPPATAGHLTLPAAEEIALPPVCAPSATASLPFEPICLTASAGPWELEFADDRVRPLALARERRLREAPDFRPFAPLPLRD